MRDLFKTFLAALLAGVCCSCMLLTGVNDDFSGKDWKVKENTFGKITYDDDGLTLYNKIDAPGYCAAYKDFEVDFDFTPYIVLDIDGKEADGRLRVQFPDTKRLEVFRYRANGVYWTNLAERFKRSGKQKVRVFLYVEEGNSSATFKELSFAADRPLADAPKSKVLKSRVVPSFTTASYYISMPEVKGLRIMYRKIPTGKWQDAHPPIRDNDDGNYRGSLVNLEEGTQYVLRAYDGNKVYYSKPFRTRSNNIIIGKTIVLNKDNFKNNLSKIVSGTPHSWVRYTSKPGFVLTNDGKSPLLTIDNAKYVIFENLTLKGGDRRAVILTNSSNITFRNCDISGWGRTGKQRFDLDGKYYTEDDCVNFDAAIHIGRCRNTIIERCFIHDPRGRANSWQFAHPAGPEAITIGNCTSTIIRYNDFVGSDEHRWNDAVESRGNFSEVGGLSRDADVYGNFMIFSSDDCIELDGGQQNVRCFGNRFEGAYCGVSVQGCMKGPSYVFDNLINDMGDEFGLSGQSLKTSTGSGGKYAKCFVFHNTFAGTGNGTATIKYTPTEICNNIFADECSLTIGKYPWVNSHNLVPVSVKGLGEGTIVSNEPGFIAPELGIFAPAEKSIARNKAKKINGFSRGNTLGAMQSNHYSEQLPRRPLPVSVDAGTLKFERGELEKHVTATACKSVAFRQSFTIVKTDAADWFEVFPSSGILQTGQSITFSVKLKKERLPERRNWRGAFLIRFADGLSRPVAVYAKACGSSIKNTAKKLNANVIFIEAEKPVSGSSYKVIDDPAANGKKALDFKANGYVPFKNPPKDQKFVNTYEFSVPKDGYYTIALRMRADQPFGSHDSLYAGVDSDKLVFIGFGKHISTEWKWAVAPRLRKTKELSGSLGACYLKAGKHTLKLAAREQLYLDAIAISDDPEVFITW